MENIKKTQAMHAAGLGCAISIAIIAYFLFTPPTEQLMDYLTALGHWFGASTTVGIFVLACLPVLVSVLFYWIYYWLKN